MPTLVQVVDREFAKADAHAQHKQLLDQLLQVKLPQPILLIAILILDTNACQILAALITNHVVKQMFSHVRVVIAVWELAQVCQLYSLQLKQLLVQLVLLQPVNAVVLAILLVKVVTGNQNHLAGRAQMFV
jgi:hypothetical protein